MHDIIAALLASDGSDARERIQRELKVFRERMLLGERFPADCFSVIIQILSNPSLSNEDVAAEFVGYLMTDAKRMSVGQKEYLAKVIKSNYAKYTCETICFIISDVIYRCYNRNEVFKIFAMLFPVSSVSGRDGIVLGLDILSRDADPEELVQITNILALDKS